MLVYFNRMDIIVSSVNIVNFTANQELLLCAVNYNLTINNYHTTHSTYMSENQFLNQILQIIKKQFSGIKKFSDTKIFINDMFF